MAERIVVTGGSGQLGGYVIAEFASRGYEVFNADIMPPAPGSASAAAQYWRIALGDYGEVVAALAGADGVVHLAATTTPGQDPEHKVFRANTASTWNVLDAAEVHGIRRICLASSVAAIGAGWGARTHPPRYLPIDEEHPTRAEDAYSQSKWICEQMADGFARRRPGGVQIASLRFPALWSPATARRHVEAGDKSGTGARSQRGFWSWVGRNDAARACRLAIETPFTGHEVFFITSDDTYLDIPTEQAIRSAYPGIETRGDLPGFSSAISIGKARTVLGWVPRESWRDGTLLEPETHTSEPPPYRPQWTRRRQGGANPS